MAVAVRGCQARTRRRIDGYAGQSQLDRARTSRAIGSLTTKALVHRVARQGDARRAVVRITARGQALYDEMFPQVAAINRAVLSALDDPLLAALDEALQKLTAHAAALGTQLVSDVQADRRRRGATRR